jgi:hypothetical protein
MKMRRNSFDIELNQFYHLQNEVKKKKEYDKIYEVFGK